LFTTPGAPASHEAPGEHASGTASSTLYISQLAPGAPGVMIGMSTPKTAAGGTDCEALPVFDPWATRPTAVAWMPCGVVISRPAAGRFPPWQAEPPHLVAKMGSTCEQKSTAVAPEHASEPVYAGPAFTANWMTGDTEGSRPAPSMARKPAPALEAGDGRMVSS